MEQPYGSWPSAITTELVVEAAVSLGEVAAGDDDIWWSELRPQQAGRVMIVRHEPGGRDVDVLPEGYSARTRVHEYGGGAWWLHDDTLFFANWSDQRLYRIDPDTEPATFLAPVALTPEPAVPQGDRYADGVLSADGRWVICVREHHEPGAAEARNEIVAVRAEPAGPPDEPQVLVSGPDFVAAPRVSPDGSRLCWIQWNHPDMPWDGTELVVADLASEEGGCTLSASTVLAGSRHESVTQPEWHADGSLWVLSDRSNWWNLYRIDPGGVARAVAPLEAEIGVPHWVFGQSRYAFLPDGRVAIAYSSGGLDHLAIVTPAATEAPGGGSGGGSAGPSSADVVVDLEAEFVALASLRPYGHGLVFLGGSPQRETVVAVADLPRHGEATIGIIRPGRELGLGPEWFAEPRSLTVESPDGSETHAVFYAPHPSAGHRPGGFEAAPAGAQPRRADRGGSTAAEPGHPVLDLTGIRRGRRQLPRQHGLRARVPPGPVRPMGGGRRRRLRGRGPAPGGRRAGRRRSPGHPGRQRRGLHHPGRAGLPRRVPGRHQPVRGGRPRGPGPRHPQVRVPLPRLPGGSLPGRGRALPRAFPDPPRARLRLPRCWCCRVWRTRSCRRRSPR